MNTKLIVRKSADANYIAVKYAVVEMTPGATAAATYCLIQTIDSGFASESDFNDWKASKSPDGIYSNPGGRDSSVLVGTIGELEVVALSTLEAYTPYRPSFDRQG